MYLTISFLTYYLSKCIFLHIRGVEISTGNMKKELKVTYYRRNLKIVTNLFNTRFSNICLFFCSTSMFYCYCYNLLFSCCLYSCCTMLLVKCFTIVATTSFATIRFHLFQFCFFYFFNLGHYLLLLVVTIE